MSLRGSFHALPSFSLVFDQVRFHEHLVQSFLLANFILETDKCLGVLKHVEVLTQLVKHKGVDFNEEVLVEIHFQVGALGIQHKSHLAVKLDVVLRIILQILQLYTSCVLKFLVVIDLVCAGLIVHAQVDVEGEAVNRLAVLTRD